MSCDSFESFEFEFESVYCEFEFIYTVYRGHSILGITLTTLDTVS